MVTQVCPPFTATGKTGQFWVGSYEELGANVSGGAPAGQAYFPLLAYGFGPAANKTAAQSGAHQCLLAGPFATQADAQHWADSFNTNPNTVQAGSGLSPSTGTTTAGSGAPTGGLGTALNNIDDFFAKLKDANTWLRIGEVILGIVLIAASVGKLTGANNVVTNTVKKVPVIL